MGSNEATPPVQSADSAQTKVPDPVTLSNSQQQLTKSGGDLSNRANQIKESQVPQPNQAAMPLTPKKVESETIPIQTLFQNETTTSNTAINEQTTSSLAHNHSPSESVVKDSTKTATAPPPADDASPATSGLFSRIKKKVVETAWQGSESKVRYCWGVV